MEDNKLDVFMVREALVRHRISGRLDVVEDGEAAMQFIQTVEQDEITPCPDLVLLDLNLPKRSGTEVLAFLRRAKRWTSAKIWIVTSSNSAEDRATTEQMGADGYFLKPASYEEFLKIGEIILRVLGAPDTK